MLRAEGLDVAYGKLQALWGVTFDVPSGEIVALIGANGAGKTTTLRAVSGLLRPRAGAIVLGGERLDRLSPAEIVERGVVHVPEGRKLFPDMTVLDNLLMGGYARTARAHRRRRLEEVFAVFPRLAERRAQLAATLSGGEQQMVAIGRGLMARPKVLMLDEPSLGLAPIMVVEMFRVIAEINRGGVTVLLVEQNTEHALALAHRGFVLESGRVVLSGTGAELLANEQIRQAYLGL
jgi:branched-chain amino acid transport system ATP-binding protein